MEEVRSVKTDSKNTIFALNDLGSSGENHSYIIAAPGRGPLQFHHVNFQKAPEDNGCTNEDLLAIARDRLECFQAGPFPCEENVRASGKIQEALDWLNHRTQDRTRRGVEGKNEQ